MTPRKDLSPLKRAIEHLNAKPDPMIPRKQTAVGRYFHACDLLDEARSNGTTEQIAQALIEVERCLDQAQDALAQERADINRRTAEMFKDLKNAFS